MKTFLLRTFEHRNALVKYLLDNPVDTPQLVLIGDWPLPVADQQMLDQIIDPEKKND